MWGKKKETIGIALVESVERRFRVGRWSSQIYWEVGTMCIT